MTENFLKVMLSQLLNKLQGFSYLSEVEARGLLNLGKKHLDHQNWENFMQSKRVELPFKWIKTF